MNPDIRVTVSGARSGAVGADHGATPSEFRELAERVREAHRALQDDRSQKRQGFYDLHNDKALRAAIKVQAREVRRRGFENLVVLGIGGSALGLTTLVTALKPPYFNLLSQEDRGGAPRVFVLDNIDPDTFAAMLELCPPEKTLFNVISLSGGTSETLSQALIVLDHLRKALGKSKVHEHVVITTGARKRGAKDSPLQRLQDTYKTPGFTLPSNVGGRFSVFTAVGLFPAAVLGIDIDDLASGCRAMDRRTSRAELMENPAYLRAALHWLLRERKGKSISVMMPYSDALRDAADWYCQLWAESLGKRVLLDGSIPPAGIGQTPVKALGATDQHSQLQLYLEGPNDKVITILEQASFSHSMRIPPVGGGMAPAKYLGGKTMAKLMTSERKATEGSLREAQRPVIRITLPKVTAHSVGQLLYMLQVETAMAGRLFGVNAFDQPAVESIKVRTRQFMGGAS